MENFENIKKYFINIYNLSISYLEEIINNIDNNDKKDILNDIINKNKFNIYFKKINNINDEILFTNILNIKHELDLLINTIQNINIYEELKLLSDTTKNNYDTNKLFIISLNKKIQIKYLNFLNEYIINFCKNYKYTYENYKKINEYYNKFPIIIDLYINIIKQYLNIENLEYKNEILLDNKELKNNILNKILDDNEIKYNKNNFNSLNYLFKNNIIQIRKNNNIINKYNNIIIHKIYNNLNEIFIELYNSNFYFKNNKLDNKNNDYILKILKDYYKIEKEYLSIILIESNFDNINYNLTNLLNDNYKLIKNQGVDINFINKTKTIVKNKEIDELIASDKKYKNDIYLQNIQNITLINNYNISKKIKENEMKKLLLDTNFILIYKINDIFYLMKYYNKSHAFIKYNDINILLQNCVDYYIENYNNIFENNILNFIKDNNILNTYNQKINLDYKNILTKDNLELKNNIINKIKKNIKDLTKNSKNDNIDNILDIIIVEIYNYIQKINNIDFNSEIYLTYYSNINSIINKIKKELNDTYDEKNILDSIENIINNLYSTIIKINDNLLDKYYILNL